jgi:peptidoglycan/xylan/chitin deacetylase (PgdA/CDA1 family)
MYKATARVVKLVGSLIYYVVTTLWKRVQQLQGREFPGSCVVLCYHAVPRNQRARFARQMDVLRRYVKPVRADVEAPLSAGKRCAAVTFDDAYQSVIQNALPELQKRTIPCALFVVTHLLGQSAPWSGTTGFSRDDRFITVEQLVGLSSDLVLIGSHTMTHPHLPSLAEDAARRELSESRRLLQRVLQREVRLFAFPHGAFNASLVRCCQEAGYQRVFSIERTTAFSDGQEYVIGRVSTDPTDWGLEFRLKVLGAYRWLPTIFEIKRKTLARMARFRRV